MDKLAWNSFVKANNLPLVNSLNSCRGSLTVEEAKLLRADDHVLQKLRCLQQCFDDKSFDTKAADFNFLRLQLYFPRTTVMVCEFAYHFIETSPASYNCHRHLDSSNFLRVDLDILLRIVEENHTMLSRLAFLCYSDLNCAVNFDIHSYWDFKTEL